MSDTLVRPLQSPLWRNQIAVAAALAMLLIPLPAAAADLPPSDSPSDVPRDGKGALTFGGMLLIGGATSTAFGLQALIGNGGWGFGFAEVGLGAIAIGTGIGTTVLGVKRQRRYLAWQSTSSLRPPAQGNGLLAAGTTTLIASIVIITTSSTNWLLFDETPRLVFVGWGVSSAGFAVGTALLIAGTVRRGRFERWQESAILLPTASFGPQGLRLGLTGRF